MKRIPTIIGASILAASALFLTGCSETGKLGQGFADADVSGQNKAPAIIGTMPDGFSNFAAKCDGPNMVYVIFHGNSSYGALDVVPNDPRCVDN